jgi:hypothetical protein
MKTPAKVAAIAGSALALFTGLIIASGTAGAATASPQPKDSCNTGVWAGWDNTQADANNLAISAVGGKVVALAHQAPGLFGIGGSNDCFYWFGVAGHASTDNAKYAVEVSPQTGLPEGEALTAEWSGPGRPWVIGLGSTEKGSTTQEFVWNGSTDFAVPGANGDVLQSNGNGKQITLVPAADAGTNAATTWHYVGL